MANQSNRIKTKDEECLVVVATSTAEVCYSYLSLCPETSSNYPFAKSPSSLDSVPHNLTVKRNPESLASALKAIEHAQGSKSVPVTETPPTAKSEAVMDASAKGRSPSVSSDRSISSSSTSTAAQTPRFLKVCPVHYGRGDGLDDFSPA